MTHNHQLEAYLAHLPLKIVLNVADFFMILVCNDLVAGFEFGTFCFACEGVTYESGLIKIGFTFSEIYLILRISQFFC